ncbi:MAG: alpha/beta hydrolase [Sphingobium sp.]
MALDAPSAAFVEAARRNAGKPREEMSPAEAREATAKMRAVMADGPAMEAVVDLDARGGDGTVPARLFVPEGGVRGLIVYFHGGGWVVGSLAEFDPLCRELAQATGCAVVAVQYRKAPEHPYPDPVEDAWSSLLWIVERQQALVGRSLPIIVGGDSAGGNLAIAVTMRARSAGAPALAGQLLIYPVADCDFDRPSYLDPENQLSLTRSAMMWYWNQYAPDAARRVEPELSPCRASDLTGLPPAIILTAEHDVLRDEGEAYAARLVEAGVPVIHKRFAGQLHAFAMLVGFLPGSASAVSFIGDAVRRVLSSLDNRDHPVSEGTRT